jgi:transcriptional regulator with XRE-family HTH domain
MPRPLQSDPSVIDMQVSMELRMFRERLLSDVSAQAVARALNWSQSKISRYEQARTPVTRSGLEEILDYYVRVHRMSVRQAKEIRAMHAAALEAAWLQHPYLGAGVSAPAIREWAPLYVPRLLQVPAYAGAVLTDLQPVTHMPPHEITTVVTAVIRWRSRLKGRPPELLHAVIDEPVLTRAPGKPGVLAEQLEYLEAMAGDGAVQVRVLPAAATGVPRWAPAFRCLEYARETGAQRIETDELEGPGQPLSDDGLGAWRRRLLFDALWRESEPAGPVIRKLLSVTA